MNYEMETLAKTLKQAREAKRLSQRELSKRTGVPQSHISKIEKAGVDLRVSSLNAIANALDLELALVPRKAIPAVKSISRTTEPQSMVPREIARAMAQIKKQINAVGEMDIDPKVFENLLHRFRELNHVQALIPDLMQLNHINRLMNEIVRHGKVEAALAVTNELAKIRNDLVHSGSEQKWKKHSQPKYQLDGDDDG